MNKLYEFDNNYNYPIGVDEAGRGPLAGPVVAACVRINNYIEEFELINDSKKLTEKKREELFDTILANCEVGIGIVDEKKIDEINILNATFLAMNIALSHIEIKNSIILVDGNKKIKNCNYNQKTIVKGDSKSLAIAAASIIAKVTRDKIMIEEAKKYPIYKFEKHKGYGTKEHRELLLKYGKSPIHRKSFLNKILEKNKNKGEENLKLF
ncbi:RNase HII [Hypnocyclicus thermotrophus]|uniref:Ribonuclease HII n=1 Tax=Hypnocyclicus thermotrophus TaxID=1627895 RepID=A0AA46I5G8_9FUSO|nr:ribonuclease HII [Hypnocyclicus thermotrophus]TDT68084.1 RNase HII [Hypnocyclicus thermotrophus]